MLLGYGGLSGFRGELQRVTVRSVLDDLGRNIDVDGARETAALTSLTSLAMPRASDLKREGQLLIRAAFADGLTTQEAHEQLRRGRSALLEGLAQSPADGFAWLLLTQAEVTLNGFTPLAHRAFQMSLERSPNEPSLLLAQLDYGLLLWPVLRPPERAAVLEAARQLAVHQVQPLARIAKQRNAVERVRAALDDLPKRQEIFVWLVANK